MGQQGDRRDESGGGRMTRQVPLVYYNAEGEKISCGHVELSDTEESFRIFGTITDPIIQELVLKDVNFGLSVDLPDSELVVDTALPAFSMPEEFADSLTVIEKEA